MDILLEKESYTIGKVDLNYAIWCNGVSVGRCLVEVMNGKEEDLLNRYDAEEAHNCFDILQRIKEVDPSKLLHKIAFIRLIEINEALQQKGIGRAALTRILKELCEQEYDFVILDAFKGGYLIPFYESFGFEKIPFPESVSVIKRTPHNGENYMWKRLRH